MRKIETQMNMAIKSQKNWSSGNTQVITDNGFSRVFLHGNHIANVFDDVVDGNVKTTSFFDNDVYCEESEVFLHGNHIATYNHVNRELALFDGGWQTVTTKSRLNALCNEFATGFGVFQKNWDWFVSDFDNKNVIDFFNGVTVYSDGVFIK